MPNANTSHSRALRARTAREWEAGRKQAGYKRVCVILSPAAAARLNALAAAENPPSKNAALERLLLEPSRNP